MRQGISNLQLIFLVANFIFSSSIISLPQIIVQIGGQNAWLVPLILFPLLLVVIFLIFGRNKRIEPLKNLFLVGNKSTLREKGFIFFFLLFVVLTFLIDLRALIDFIATVLLPTTPINMLMVLTILVITYIAMAGIEVISRINALHFVILLIVILILPFLLVNEWEGGNLQPLPSLNTITSTMKTVFFSFSWMGEILFFIIIIAKVNPVREARRAVITGTALGLFLFLIILILEIMVLGTKIVKEALYPSYILIQQINLTDFLDRLDLVIVAVWVPTLLAKASFLLYAINHCFSYLYKSDTNKFLLPISFILGFLAILLFKNNMDHLHFSFYSWDVLGLFLEVMIIFLFFLVKRIVRK